MQTDCHSVYRVPNTIPLEATSCLLLQGTLLCSFGGCCGLTFSIERFQQHTLLVSKRMPL